MRLVKVQQALFIVLSIISLSSCKSSTAPSVQTEQPSQSSRLVTAINDSTIDITVPVSKMLLSIPKLGLVKQKTDNSKGHKVLNDTWVELHLSTFCVDKNTGLDLMDYLKQIQIQPKKENHVN